MTDQELVSYLESRDALCPSCGYGLRGIRSDVCPECAYRLSLSEFLPPEGGDRARSADSYDFFIFLCEVPIVLGFMLTLLSFAAEGPVHLTVARLAGLGAMVLLAYVFLSPFQRLIRVHWLWLLLVNPVVSGVLAFVVFFVFVVLPTVRL